MASVEKLIESFFGVVERRQIEIYNEFSLQHELGIYLRNGLRDGRKVQFERPVGSFRLEGSFLKKEIDIAVFLPDGRERLAVELRFPRNGQYPEQMSKACQDIRFLEQLVRAGFDAGIFVMAAEDRLFYQGHDHAGIYAFFRGGCPLHGRITKPTGRKDEAVTIDGLHTLRWQDAGETLRYVNVGIGARGDSIFSIVTMMGKSSRRPRRFWTSSRKASRFEIRFLTQAPQIRPLRRWKKSSRRRMISCG